MITIGTEAFNNCTSLSSINLPDSITTIESLAFHNTKITAFYLKNVTTIGSGAFSGNNFLTKIYIPSSVTTIPASTATNSPFFGDMNVKIYCTASSSPAGFETYWNYKDATIACSTYYDCFGITFDEGANYSGTALTDLTSQTVVPTLTALTEDGYNFDGWYYDGAFTSVTTAGNDLFSNATDSNAVTLYANWTASPLTFTGQSLSPSAIFNTSYTSNSFTGATNGTGTYTYEIISALNGETSLAGILLDSETRIFSGTPTSSVGTYSIIVRATDSNSNETAEATFTLIVGVNTLSTPTNLAWNTTSQGSAIASWDAVPNATSYLVALYNESGTLIQQSGPPSNSCEFGINFKTGAYLNCYFTVYSRQTDVDNYNNSSTATSSSTVSSYIVTFNSNGGSDVTTKYVIEGQLATRPSENPTKTGYTFENWFSNIGLTDVWDFDTDTITADTTLYAKWTANDLTFTGQSLENAIYNTLYSSFVFNEAGNGTGNYTYEIISGAPTGIILNTETRVLYGTPTSNVNTYNIIIRATDGVSGKTADATFALEITAGQIVCSIEGYEGTYDSSEHYATIILTTPSSITVEYSGVFGDYKDYSLTAGTTQTTFSNMGRTDAGSTTIYYQITATNYDSITGSVTVVINKANLDAPTNLTWNTSSQNSAVANWTAVDGANSYTVTLYNNLGVVSNDMMSFSTSYDFGSSFHSNKCTDYYFTVLALPNFGDLNYNNSQESGESVTLSSYKTTFNSNGGSEVISQYIIEGQKIGEPSEVELNGFILSGWYLDDETFANAWNFETNVVSSDITLHAKWTVTPLTFSNETLSPNATCHSSYTSNAFTEASGGLGSYTYEIVSGAPDGISLNGETRMFSGTPTSTPGIIYSIVVKATDSETGATKNATFTLYLFALKLSTPINLNWNTTLQGSAVAIWDEVSDANGYTISLYNNFDSLIDTQTTLINNFDFGSVFTASACLSYYYKVIATSLDITYSQSTLSTKSENMSSFTISFNINGGDSITPNEQYIISGQKASAISDPTKSNYTFYEWFKDETLLNTWDFETDIISDTTTLFAGWNYDITLNSNYGDTPIENYLTDCLSGKEVDLTPSALTRTGYTFKGWATTSDSITPNYTLIYMDNGIFGSTTLYAVFEIQSFTISFDFLGGAYSGLDGKFDNKIYEYNYSFTLPSTDGVTKNGYTFSYWSDGTNHYLSQTGSFSVDEDVTLFPDWSANSYAVTYNGNGATGEIVEHPVYTQGFEYDVPQNLNENIYYKTGYTFAGWNRMAEPTIETPGVSFTDGQSVLNLTIEKDANVTIYAQWTANSYSVSFNVNTTDLTTGTMDNQEFTYDEEQSLTANTFSREHYIFKGWNTVAEPAVGNLGTSYTDGQEIFNLTSTDNEIVTLYAVWEIEQKTITYILSNVEGGSVPSAQSFDYNSTATILGNVGNLVKTGHHFVCWNTAGNGTGTNYTEAQEFTILGDISLYPVFEVNQYIITLDVAGGDELQDNSFEINYGGTLSGLPSPTRASHIFLGWFYGSTYVSETDTYALTENITLIAHWIITYSVTFNDGDLEIQVFNETAGTFITPPPISKTGYTFTGWNAPEEEISFSEGNYEVPSQNIVFFAVWEINTYTITFNTNDGELLDSIVQDYNTAVTLPTPVREGYDFLGWFDNEQLSGTEVSMSTILENTALFAKWEIKEITLSFVVDGGSAVEAIVDEYNSTISLPTPIKEGYIFKGWYLDEECLISADEMTNMPSENTILYASWEKVEANTLWFYIMGLTIILILGIVLVFLNTRTKKHYQVNIKKD